METTGFEYFEGLEGLEGLLVGSGYEGSGYEGSGSSRNSFTAPAAANIENKKRINAKGNRIPLSNVNPNPITVSTIPIIS